VTRSANAPIRRRSAAVLALAVAVVLLAGCGGSQRDETTYSTKVENNFTGQCWVQVVADANPDVAKSFKLDDSLSNRQDKVTSSKVPKTQVKAAQNYCGCVYTALKKTVKFGEFKKINENLREKGGTLPKPFTEAYSSCQLAAA
jgi:ABC-type uncharacterized transport system auxiliary subunit